MTTNAIRPRVFLIAAIAFFLLMALPVIAYLLLADQGPFNSADAYEQTFDEVGSWGVGSSADVQGSVNNGRYEMLVRTGYGLFTATGGQDFGDGIYEVKATQISGPLNNGYGMVIRVDEATDSFYAFEVSGDGYVWIGWCRDLCRAEAVALVGGDWFPSAAVKAGLMETNLLRVVVNGPRMTFFVNGIQVGRTSDSRLTEGDIGVMVETLGQRNVGVSFDEFRVAPP